MVNERMYSQVKLWHELAVRFLGGKCAVCGNTEDLHIHHIDGNWLNNDVKNLELLCSKHHARMRVDKEAIDVIWGKIHRIRLGDNEIRVIERALMILVEKEYDDTVMETCLHFTQLKSRLTEGTDTPLPRPRAKGKPKIWRK